MCSRCVRISVGTRVPGRCSRYVQQQLRTYSSWYFFLQCTYVHQQQVHAVVHQWVQYVLTECRCGRYLSALQQYLFFQYVNVPTDISSAVCTCSSRQYVLHSSRYSTCAYSSCNRYSSRYSRYVHAAIDTSVGICSTFVSTAAVGTVVGSVDTCATSLQRPGNAIDHGELNITVFRQVFYNSITFCAFIGLCDQVRFFANARIPGARFNSYLPIYY